MERMNVTERRGPENEMKGQYLTHVASVRVCAPPHRDVLEAFIYGEISFNVGDSDGPVTLYSRVRDKPDLLYLEHFREGRNLTLSDDHESHRALAGVSPDNPLHMKMELYEKKGSGEDVLIAKLQHWDSCCERDSGRYFVVPGESGFRFEVCYSVVFGALVEVEAQITEGGEGNSMFAQLSAYQFLGKSLPPILSLKAELYPYQSSIPDKGQQVGETITSLVTICEKFPVTLIVGERMDLKRRFVVAPMKRGRYLSIALAAAISDEDVAEDHEVYFPLRGACRQRSHIRRMKFANGTVLSVSIKYVDPGLVLEEDARTCGKLDSRFSHPSLKRPRPFTGEHEHGDGVLI